MTESYLTLHTKILRRNALGKTVYAIVIGSGLQHEVQLVILLSRMLTGVNTCSRVFLICEIDVSSLVLLVLVKVHHSRNHGKQILTSFSVSYGLLLRRFPWLVGHASWILCWESFVDPLQHRLDVLAHLWLASSLLWPLLNLILAVAYVSLRDIQNQGSVH